ncbi:MAG: DUF4339 domain-containing protein [Microthrixaceae bacterium]
MSDLPPTDQAQCYVVVGPDDQRGPYTLELLVTEVVAGRLDENTPVWWPGLADWTTMAAHPGVAAEVTARRGAPQVEPSPYAPPPPGEYAAAAQPTPDPAQAQAVEEVLRAGGSEPTSVVAATPQFATDSPAVADPTAGNEPVFGVGGQPADAPVADLQVAAAPTAAAPAPSATAPGALGGLAQPQDLVEGPAVEVPEVEVTPADFEAVDAQGLGSDSDGYRAAGAGEGLDPMHSEAFADLIRRSRARADAASMIDNADGAFVSAFDSAATKAGFTRTAEGDSANSHELTYMGAPGETLMINLGRVTGHLLATGGSHVDLEASCASERFAGELDAGAGEHGEIVVANREGGVGAAASVSLHLPLEDYVGEDHAVDEIALDRDANAVVATLADRIRG